MQIKVPTLFQIFTKGTLQDVQLFKKYGILKHTNSGDIYLSWQIVFSYLLNPLQAQLKIPSFLKGRANLSAVEKIEIRKIAKAQIHVE